MTGEAFGGPGDDPRWARGAKDAVVAAYSMSSLVWAAVSAGIVNEIYFPTIDSPQTRDLQFLITDGESFFHDERRDTETTIERLDPAALSFRVTNRDRHGRYAIEKEIITAPHAACLLQHIKLRIHADYRDRLRLFALLAPHLQSGGQGNTGALVRKQERLLLTAERGQRHLVADCSSGFRRGSCGFVGASDGWTDLRENLQMDWEFTTATEGNIALTGEIDLPESLEFTLAVGFGFERHGAIVAVAESLAIPFSEHLDRFHRQWERACEDRLDSLVAESGDEGQLFRMSYDLFLAHEDKTYKGATIASLSIPWGQVRRDDEIGGYHLIWPRDLVAIMSGLMAAGEYDTPLRGLIYLAAGQRDDGGFHQNTWIDGRPYWNGIQLDEVAFPVLLAWRLQQADALGCFDPYPMVRSAAKYLVLNGPDTPQDRWEECSGFCPSTLAVQIAALVCAGCMARQRGEPALADYFIGHADFLEQHIEEWTVTERGELHEEIPRHYVRVLPTDPQQCERPDQIDDLTVTVDNRPGMPPREFLARNMVDPSFLELVRYGIRRSDDPLIVDSLRVVDHVLRVGTPGGPCWRRYNHDGHGQRDDGGPLENGGRGRAWTLLTAERGMYELAAGAESDTHIRAMEFFSGPAGLLPEQVWDGPDLPESHLECGKATGSATPLVWAHAEYVKLLRSRSEERIFDRIDVVHQRYCEECEAPPRVQIWQDNSRPSRVRGDETLRVQLRTPFQLRWHDPSQESMRSTDSVRVDDDLHYADLRPDSRPQGRLQFELQWQSQPDEPDSRECTAKFSIDCSSPRAGG